MGLGVTWLPFCLLGSRRLSSFSEHPSLLTFCTFQMSPPPQIPPEIARGRQAQVLLPEESEVGLT